ncbi:MAG: metal ABC transporter permease [Phototrophicaceae bacterium]|jgi:ABC-type Mn2+/Zn2+ transport system permease subunit
MQWIEWFTNPLTYQFMQRAFAAALLVGALCGIIGSYVVVRGMAFFGDALSHTILPGVALAFVFGQDLFIGGLLAALVSVVGINWLASHPRLSNDTAIGVVFVTMFALGIAIISSARSYSADLAHILFGNLLGVELRDLYILVGYGVVVLVVIVMFYKELLILSFDETLLRVLRLPVANLRLLLLLLIALTIVASLQTVGISLVLAMLITPAATAQILTQRLHLMMIWAAGLGAGSGVIGLYVSYYLNFSSGAAIVLTSSTIFIVVLIGQSLFNRISARQHAP